MSELPLGKPLHFQVFSDSALGHIGSIQEVILFDNETIFSLCRQKNHFEDEIDHAFALIQNENSLLLNCFNKEGMVPFPGSSAYALAHLYLKNHGPSGLIINSGGISYKAHKRDDVIWLETDRKTPCKSKEEYGILKNISHDLLSGDYFSRFESKKEIENFSWGAGEILSIPFENIRSLTIFYWDKLNNEGYLRSFFPWHGRKEDQVTACAQYYLSSIVFEKYGVEKQKWTQLSKNKGQIHIEVKEKSIYFSGNVSPLLKN